MTAIAAPASHVQLTGLMRHLLPFDANNDGTVTRKEAANFIHDLGLDRFSAEIAATIINGAFAKPTTGKQFPLNIDIANIAAAKHPGDSKVYDKQGRVDEAKLGALWATYDPSGKGALTGEDLKAMIRRNSESSAPAEKKKGMIASGLEFLLLLEVTSEVNVKGEKVLTKEALRSFYDGTLFGRIADERRQLLDAAKAGGALLAVNAGAAIAARAHESESTLAVPLDADATMAALMKTKHIGPVVWSAVSNAIAAKM